MVRCLLHACGEVYQTFRGIFAAKRADEARAKVACHPSDPTFEADRLTKSFVGPLVDQQESAGVPGPHTSALGRCNALKLFREGFQPILRHPPIQGRVKICASRLTLVPARQIREDVPDRVAGLLTADAGGADQC